MEAWEGFTPAQKLMMQLSQEALEGLRMTGEGILSCIDELIIIIHFAVLSFVEVTEMLLSVPGVQFLLSEKFCQDPLESYFGKQRYRGGSSDNPSVKEFIDNAVSLRVQGSAALEPLRGNCSRKQQSGPLLVDETPYQNVHEIGLNSNIIIMNVNCTVLGSNVFILIVQLCLLIMRYCHRLRFQAFYKGSNSYH